MKSTLLTPKLLTLGLSAAALCVALPASVAAQATEVAKLTAPNAESNDFLGQSIATREGLIAVGAPGRDDGAEGDAGAVLIYRRDDLGVEFEQEIKASDVAAERRFGSAVAFDSRGLIVGANGLGAQPPFDPGAVYVFTVGTDLDEAQRLTPSDTGNDDAFGSSLAVDGDLLVVGAPYRDGAAFIQGAAYVFEWFDGIGYVEQVKLLAPDGAAFDFFGHSVAVSGTHVAVGAPGRDGAAANEGAVYLFERDGFGWTFDAKLTASDAGAKDGFGRSVVLAGDSVIVGAPFAGLENLGAAYVFDGSASGWTEGQVLTGLETAQRGSFGWAAALADGLLVIGAPKANVRGVHWAGRVYGFRRDAGSWELEETFVASDRAILAGLGTSVATDGELVSAGAVAEIPLFHGVFPSTGAAYVFDAP
jgi:hypothetical protein